MNWRLCCGCGACCYSSTDDSISMQNLETIGMRPVFENGENGGPIMAHPYCPGFAITDNSARESPISCELGRVLDIWEGFASDQELRFKASSGGLLSALSLYCLEKEGMRFVLHAAMDDENPYRNKTIVSKNREDILHRTGSRYAPSSPCEGLQMIEDADGPCVFIGKPCDVAAVFELRKTRPRLDRNLGLVLTFFCAGTPSTAGTLKLIEKLYKSPKGLRSLRYRGDGWPGSFKGTYAEENNGVSMAYDASWSFLTSYRPWRCNICPDGLGRLADLACGDAWHRFNNDGSIGLSLVLVRNESGRSLLRKAVQAGYVSLEQSSANNVHEAQENLLRRREELYGRLLALKFAGIPVPQYSGFSLKETWERLPITERVRIFLKTAKRIMKYKLWKPRV